VASPSTCGVGVPATAGGEGSEAWGPPDGWTGWALGALERESSACTLGLAKIPEGKDVGPLAPTLRALRELVASACFHNKFSLPVQTSKGRL
jgi:hypothetical protein